jgi:hypothetical protein
LRASFDRIYAVNISCAGSYTFATGYTFPEYSVQKGVPYPHFQKAVDENIKLRDVLKNKIWAKLNPLS